jgi:hypothetical protein
LLDNTGHLLLVTLQGSSGLLTLEQFFPLAASKDRLVDRRRVED